MRDFWDARAAEQPYYFVDNRARYHEPDLERFWGGGREALDGMLDRLGTAIAPADRIVEIGCGVGRITRVLAERGEHITAIDVSQRMLEIARELNPSLENVSWMLGDGRSLAPLEGGIADVIHSDVVFQHIPDPEITMGYVREMGRVLRPGGWAAFQVSNDPAIHRRPSVVRRARLMALSKLGRGPSGQDDRAWLGSPVDIDRLSDVATTGGMTVERIVGAGTQHCHVLLRRVG